MRVPKKIKIKVTKTEHWYKEGQIIEVGNYITFGWGDKEPHFERTESSYGIPLKNCVVLSKCEPIPEYTIEELKEKIGHEFKIKRV